MTRLVLSLFVSFLMFLLGCGGPQDLSNSNTNNQNQLGTTACAPGFKGVDSDGDGLPDKCEELLGTPKNVADCDHNGIPDNLDDPKSCLSPTDPKKDPNKCDAACQDKRNRTAQEVSDALALGGAAVQGQSYPGVDILVKNMAIAFTNAQGHFAVSTAPAMDGLTSGLASVGITTHRLDEKYCKEKNANFYLFTYGDVTYTKDKLGNTLATPDKKENINFEVCGTIETYSADASGFENLKISLAYIGTITGIVPYSALAGPTNNDVESSFTLTLDPTSKVAPASFPSDCQDANIQDLVFDRMSLTMTSKILAVTTGQIIRPDGTIVPSSGQTFSTSKVQGNWKRYARGASCTRIKPEPFYNQAGFWVKN